MNKGLKINDTSKNVQATEEKHHMGAPRAHHQFPEYEELKRDSPGGGIRKFFLAVYIIIGSLVTAALIALVVLAPTRDSLYEAGILAKEPLY